VGTNKTHLQIVLTQEEKSALEKTARSLAIPHRYVVRAKLILLLAAGYTLSEVGRQVRLQRRIVRKWANRFLRKRQQGLEDDPRSGRPARFSPRSGPPFGKACV
jgi:DNA-directed RNA polymerase sigma subunit (sigma70/sigma32)